MDSQAGILGISSVDPPLGCNRAEHRFPQESNCKGICLQMCKLPAQQFFGERLGLPLSVSPDFETQAAASVTWRVLP